MFADWYFCRCIDSPPRKTSAFLAILDTFRNHSGDQRLPILAFEELRRTDMWMQIYALPTVLEALQQPELSPNMLEQARIYLHDLYDLFSPQVDPERDFANLIAALLGSRNLPVTVLRACASVFSTNNNSHDLTTAPYLDLKEFLPETFLLAVIKSRLKAADDPSLYQFLDEQQTPAIGQLMQRALDHQLGRLAFLLAVRIAHLTAIQPRQEELLGAIAEVGAGKSAIEPDLLEVAAEVAFLNIQRDVEPDQRMVVLRIIRESLTFELFDNYFALDTQGDLARLLRSIGWEMWTEEMPHTLGLIYWQLILWNIAVRCDPCETAEQLATMWQIPRAMGKRWIVRCSGPNLKVNQRWQRDLNNLLAIQKHGDIEAQVQFGSDYDLPLDQRWLFGSPWLRINKESMRRYSFARGKKDEDEAANEAPQAQLRYSSAIKSLALMRLLGAATTAVRLMQALPPDNPHRVDLARVIAHTADVLLEVYDDWLKNFDRPDRLNNKSIRMSNGLTSLALFGRRQIDNAGRGLLSAVSPKDFLEILERYSAEGSQGNPYRDDRFYFHTAILPSILMDWITDAYTGAVGSSSQVRWLGLIPQVYRYHRAYKEHQAKKKWTAALIMRFLRQDGKPFEVGFDWRKKGNDPATSWEIPSSLLLLTPRLPASEWNPGWEEPQWGKLVWKDLQIPLVRAIERLAALDDIPSVSIQIQQEWKRDLIERLNAVGRTEELSRFIRLRLLEVLDYPAFKDWPEGQELIVLVLLEYGVVYDLDSLFNRVFLLNNEARTISGSTVRQILREMLLYAMWREVAISQTETRSLSNPREPQLAAIETHRLDFIRDWLNRIALASIRESSPLHPLCAVLRELYTESLNQRTGTKPQLVVADTEQRDRKKAILLPQTAPFIPDTTIRGAVCDPNAQTTTLFVDVEPAASLKRFIWQENWNQEFGRPEFWLSSEQERVSYENDIWLPDTSRFFRREPAKEVERLVYVEKKAKKWFPIDDSLTGLLLYGCEYEQGQVAVLALIGFARTSAGNLIWRFTSSPGHTYVLAPDEFVPSDAQALEDKIQQIHDHYGLLVVVRPEPYGQSVRLRLVRQPVHDALLVEHYPDLAYPYDHRNIRWRGLFERGESYARNEDGSWFIDINPPASIYPNRIAVEWEHHVPPSSMQLVPVSIKHGDPCRAMVTCEALIFQIKPLNGDWHDFLNRWFNLQVGDRLTLMNPLTSLSDGKFGDDGIIRFLTDEHISVFVEAESLTMQFMPNDLNYGNRRVAEVVEAEWIPLERQPRIAFDMVPPEAMLNGTCRGIVTSVPRRLNQQALEYIVVWQTSESVIEQPLRIETAPWTGIYQGYQIWGKLNGAGWRFTILNPKVIVRALWSVVPHDPGFRKPILYLGNAIYKQTRYAVAEKQPGQLMLLPVHSTPLRHLTRITVDGQNIVQQGGGLSLEWRGVNVGNKREREEHGQVYRRAFMRFQNRPERLVGICRPSSPDVWENDIGVAEVVIRLEECHDELVAIRRELLLERSRLTRRSQESVAPASGAPSAAPGWRELLDRYLANPEDLDAIFDGRVVRLEQQMVPAHNNPGRPGFEVDVAPDDAPFVSPARYKSKARVRLFADGKTILASFRRVKPANLFDFMTQMNASFGDTKKLDQFLLYYAGPEDADPITGLAYTERHHRFEWGYGFTLLVPERQLSYDGKPFDQVEYVLFYADIITAVKFVQSEPEVDPVNGEHVSEPLLMMDIQNIQISWEHNLYKQRTVYQFIHILSVVAEDNDIRVRHIQGIEDRHINRTTRLFERVRAVLSPESVQRLRRDLRSSGQVQEPVTVLGRLDVERFQKSDGRAVVFDHVRLTFIDSELGSPLKSGELVVLQAGHIESWPNEKALLLKAPPDLRKEDIGLDFGSKTRQLYLLRRAFSARKDLLERRFRKGPNTLNDRLLLVRVKKLERNEISLSMLDHMPPRTVEALAGLAATRDPLLAVIMQSGGRQTELSLELSPGVFVNLGRESFETRGGDIQAHGTIVRVIPLDQRADGQRRFLITRAAFPDSRYVPEFGRYAVALPKNNLLNPYVQQNNNTSSEQFWRDKLFTIGGLPQIEMFHASSVPESTQLNPPQPEQFIQLMQTPHPKIVRIEKRGSKIFMMPVMNSVPVGRLSDDSPIEEATYIILDDGQAQDLFWNDLTFGDESIAQVIQRAREESWRYHDTVTGFWVADKVERQTLGEYDLWSGPVFFEPGPHLRLRYSPPAFRRFGFPINALVQALEAKGDVAAWYPVAGYSQEDSLWIELAPGRIVEIPGQLLIKEVGLRKIPLAPIMWPTFAPGDRVALRLAADDDFDWISLDDWKPGPRKAFGLGQEFVYGPNRAMPRCLLPVIGCDRNDGALTLGAGTYTLSLPIANPDPAWHSVMLYADNQIHEAQPQHLKPDDVVLLGLNQAGEVVVLGAPDLAPRPERNHAQSWQDDHLAHIFLGHPDNLKQLIQAAGGAIPVTVELLYLPHKTLFYSRRVQRHTSYVPAGFRTAAQVVGMLDEKLALLRLGGDLVVVPASRIVSGLPVHLLAPAMEMLHRERVLLWCHGNRDGSLAFGLRPEGLDPVFMAEAITVLGATSASDTTPAGIICRSSFSLAFYWLPSAYAAWTRLSSSQLRDVFCSDPRRTFQVKRLDQDNNAPYISVIDVDVATREFQSLVQGREFVVRVIKSLKPEGNESVDEGTQRYLVESHTSLVLLECLVYDSAEPPVGHAMPVEVIRRVSGHSSTVTVVQVGKKRLTLDLPGGMLFEGGTRPQQRTQVLVPADSDRGGLVDAQLNQRLCDCFDNQGGNDASVALEWFKRNQYAAEIDLSLALKAILVLQQNGYEQAVWLLQNLGRRALRSRHVEVLATQWLQQPTYRSRRDGLWERLNRMSQYLQPPVTAEKIDVIRKFCHTVNVRIRRGATAMSDENLLLTIADALNAAIGATKDLSLIETRADISNRVIANYRHLPTGQSSPSSFTEEAMQDILNMIRNLEGQGVIFTMLDPLPYPSRSS